MANNPELLKMPLATDGDKATIPETSGATTGEFSQQYGFQQINALPLQAGGIAPRREDFNGAFNLLSGIAFYAQKGWRFAFDNSQDYFAGCVVKDATDNKSYLCITDVSAGNGLPSADTAGAHWQELPELTTFFRQPSTAYVYNDVRLAYGLKHGYFLQCTSGGTSKAGDITIPASPSVGATISDGTVTWTIRKFASTSDIPSVSSFITKAQTPAFNTRAEITTSGTWTAPVTGWYKITLKGGGAGGRGGGYDSSHSYGGAGGGEGGTTIRYVSLSAGSSVSITIGAGGAGGAKNTSGAGTFGADGGTTTVVAGGNTYTAAGGVHAQGGTGDIYGDSGGQSITNSTSNDTPGSNGGGSGGAKGNYSSDNAQAGVKGGGGAGGGGYKNTNAAKAGGNGGDGYVWIEYWA